jgi:ribosomal protein L37E
MDFNGIKCPVCKTPFKDGDDIVVCPECGTPHHRECYEIENRCAYEERHAQGFNFEEEKADKENGETNENDNTIICQRCRAVNQKGMFYCGRCGFPLSAQNQQYNQYNGQNTRNNPNMGGFGVNFTNPMDPMAGVDPEQDMGDGVTAGELSKFVQNNTHYFIRIFNNIKNFSKGRFNFCAFFFSGGYLLYRKMYKIGAIITAVMLFLWTAELYIHYCTPAGQRMIELMNNYYSNASNYTEAMNSLYKGISEMSLINLLLLCTMYFCSIAQLVLRIIVGIFANRWYFKHCKTKIHGIKAENNNPENQIQAKGGVNTAIAISLIAVYFVIEFVPFFLAGGGF